MKLFGVGTLKCFVIRVGERNLGFLGKWCRSGGVGWTVLEVG